MLDTTALKKTLCEALCAEVSLVPRKNGIVTVVTPLTFPDGDSLPIHIRSLPTGGLEFTDLGNSLMRLSYEADPAAIREGTRARILGQVLSDLGIEDREGELVLKAAGTDIGGSVFRFSQALTRVHDLSFLNRANVETTFYEDLERALISIVGSDRVHRNYAVPGIPQAAVYPVDFFIEGGKSPLYVFGVPGRDKARLSTIVIQHLQSSGHVFDSAVVFKESSEIPQPDLKRLANVANDLVMSADAFDDLERKVKHRVAA